MKVDGDNFVMELATANADLPFLMADYHLMIQPNGGRDNPADGNMSGPYKIVSDEPGVRHVFERNPNYYMTDRAHADVDRIDRDQRSDRAHHRAAVGSGQHDQPG